MYSRISILFLSLLVLGCNPLQHQPPSIAYYGDPTDRALRTSSSKQEQAHAALNALRKYDRAHPAPPYKPVYRPAIVRMVWVPDHLSMHGDLIDAHYAYVKVKDEQPAVTDAFEILEQLGVDKRDSTPFIERK